MLSQYVLAGTSEKVSWGKTVWNVALGEVMTKLGLEFFLFLFFFKFDVYIVMG